MTLTEQLLNARVAAAVIIDDAYDEAPQAEDLSDSDDEWSIFFADVTPHEEVIAAKFPAFKETSADDLRRSDDFVAVLWELRETLPGVVEPLFARYVQFVGTDREFLDRLEGRLTGLGLTVTRAGRELPEEAGTADLVFADLFLGAAQQDPDMGRSIDQVRELVAGRETSPPLVVLMSRSPLVHDKTAVFRDDAKLLASMFRVYIKEELLAGSNLERTLERLASHRADALRVARFIGAWQDALLQASAQFMAGLRRLDLSDLAHIRQLLLQFEGQPIGSYLLDILDRVHQFEIESHEPTIAAAAELNEIDPDDYPAPHIGGSADLQDLVYRATWQNPRRLAVKNTEAGAPASFGDVFILRSIHDNAGNPPAGKSEVLVVLSASCDLVREGGVKRILMMAGRLVPVSSGMWHAKRTGNLRTPIVVLPGERRMAIEWDRRDTQFLLPGEIEALSGEGGGYIRFHRLREFNALELQQDLFAHSGRVGVLAAMPGTFQVRVECYVMNPDGTRRDLESPTLARYGGVCFVGRDKDNQLNRLVVMERAVDELEAAIIALEPGSILPAARRNLADLKASDFSTKLLHGLQLPSPEVKKFKPIQAAVSKDGNDVILPVGSLGRNPEADEKPNSNLALVIVVRDTDGA